MDIDILVKKVIGVCYEVHAELGFGFSEKVFENALSIALAEADLRSKAQFPLVVNFRGQMVGEFFADLFVEEALIVELKAVKALDSSHKAQLLNYLAAAGEGTGLLVNFGAPKLEIKRLYNNRVKR